ncbi:MAG: ATP-binding cassette domain-containing protein [Clostridiales bacterium]|jgi:ABC-type sugar transport system ATPase subunit|nr:ATP-binding cassette domain-containing protein [Clostridiales bacterium]
MELLTLKNLDKRYLYGADALNGVCLGLSEGGRLVVFGGAGSGKTTLAKVISGLTGITGGEALYRGEPFANVGIRERNISACMPEAFCGRKSVYDNLYRSFELRSEGRAGFESRLREADAFFDFSHMLFKKYKDLNFYERIKAALVRCLLRDADLYLVDNAFKGLSAIDKRRLLLNAAAYLNLKPGAFIYMTDDIDDARLLGFETLILNYGSAESCGDILDPKPDGLYAARTSGFNVIRLGDGGKAVYAAVAPRRSFVAAGGERVDFWGTCACVSAIDGLPVAYVKGGDGPNDFVAAAIYKDGVKTPVAIGGQAGVTFDLKDAFYYGADESLLQ